MSRSILKLKDPEKLAIQNRFAKMVRWIAEHTIPKDMLVGLYGDGNPILALLDDSPRDDIPLLEAVSFAIFNRAMKGDIKAAEFIRDTIGEKPATNINLSLGEKETTLSALSEEDLKKLIRAIDDPQLNQKIIEVETTVSPFDDITK